MLINLTNHPYSTWSAKQKDIAQKEYGQIKDLPFPVIDPVWSTNSIHEIAQEFMEKLVKIKKPGHAKNNFAVHIQGEHTFVFHLVSLLKEQGIKCVASTTRRVAKNLNHNTKTSIFDFVQFREY